MQTEFVNTSDVLESVLSTVLNGAESGLQKAAGNQAQRIRAAFSEEGSRDSVAIDADGNRQWEPTTDIALINRENPPEFEISVSPDPTAFGPDILIVGEWETLVDTGALRDSIVAGQVKRAGDESDIEVGTDIPYAEGMDQGTTITVDGKTHDVPARPFMFMTDIEAGDTDRILDDVAGGIPNG